MEKESKPSSSTQQNVPTSLSPAQQRRLGDYLETKCLELTQGVRKRNEPDSPYNTLSAYVAAASSLVTMVLLIPPTSSSASIRTSWLLRITGDILEDVPAYSLGTKPDPTPNIPDPTEDEDEDEFGPPALVLSDEGLATLEEVFQLLEKLDEGWCAVIRNERWDSALNHGIFAQSSDSAAADDQSAGDSTGAVSVTDSTRLRSLIISGKDEFDDWLAEQGGGGNFEVSERSIRVMSHTLRELGGDIPVAIESSDTDE
ncbi:hypothetical protein BDV93DRAFT_601713 [Ceratobasidium sp. AG-I]|nr:hypothetical protein BDV93DRAFT_601713 [Ceratobasidium sp. AG-I]